MKKLFTLIIVLATACGGEDDPEFKIVNPTNGTNLETRFNKFIQLATDRRVSVPKNNMILRYVNDSNADTNDSKVHKDGEQLYIDIDYEFVHQSVSIEKELEIVIFQQLANGLLGRQFESCGMMLKVTTKGELASRNIANSNLNYDNLFLPGSSC